MKILTYLKGSIIFLYVLLSSISNRALAHTPILSLEQYKTLEKDMGATLFSAPIVCGLKSVLGVHEFNRLKSTIHLITQNEDEVQGFLSFSGNVRGLDTISEGFIRFSKDGNIWIAYLDKNIYYFTSDKASLKNPPESMKNWASRFNKTNWIYHNILKISQNNCKPADTAEQLKSCSFNEDYYLNPVQYGVVKLTGNDKVLFRGQSAYLLDGDLVEIFSAKQDEIAYCCTYISPKNRRSTGWLEKTKVQILSSKNELSLNQSKVNSLAWVGNWNNRHSQITISMKDKNFKLSGIANNGANTEDFDESMGKIEFSNGHLKWTDLDSINCKMELFLFNNALFVSDQSSECWGLGVSFEGPYYKGKSIIKSKENEKLKEQVLKRLDEEQINNQSQIINKIYIERKKTVDKVLKLNDE